jgi:hypothetical protein
VVYDLQFVPAGEVCGSARLALSPVDLLAYDFSASTKVLHVDFMPLHVGAVQLCAGPHLVAHVKVTEAAATCAFEKGDSPCSASVCAEGFEAEACQQYIAEYCIENGKTDPGCAYLLVRFQRLVADDVAVRVHSLLLEPGLPVALIREDCTCAEACAAPDADVLQATYSSDDSALDVGASFRAPGVFKLCAGTALVAELDVTEARTCAFSLAAQNPCTFAACVEDAGSDDCQGLTAEYCLTYPADSGCSLLVPNFRRVAGNPSTLELPVACAL